MSKRDYERKIREEQEATAHVFQDFINTFQDAPTPSKTFVKSGVLYADKNQLNRTEGELYNPIPLIKTSVGIKNALECAKILKDTKIEKSKKKERPKSNLEQLKEELKQRHSEKDERERLKEEIIMTGPALSYFDGGDPNSTNLFVANLNTSVTENNLMEEFGAYGPLASVKIMWPRGEDKFRNASTNCGFVAFMCRKDADRALKHMKHRTDMRVGWGKSVELPPHPVYIPQDLLRLYLPPPQSGLPFNAQPKEVMDPDEDLEAVFSKSVVKVTIPLNKKVLTLVNRVIEYVVKEGPLFEAMIMNNEIGNPEFNFLFENKSPTHVYYRWKLFSILQGEATKQWSMEPFRMFKGGSVWLPPVAPNFSEGMPEQLLNDKKESDLLSENQCERLIEIIQNLTLSRSSIVEAMVFCLNHVSAIDDVFSLIVDSLCNSTTTPPNKIARFYLLSDVISNCVAQNVTISNLKLNIQTVLDQLHICFQNIKNETDKYTFSIKVLRVVRHLNVIGILSQEIFKEVEDAFTIDCEPIDEGNSSSDEPLDGASLLKRSLKNSSEECVITPTCLKAKQNVKIQQEYFVPSKWDAVDPEEVEAQAMSSTQLYFMDLDGDPLEEEVVKVVSREHSPSSRKRKQRSKRHRLAKLDSSPEQHSNKSKKKKSYRM